MAELLNQILDDNGLAAFAVVLVLIVVLALFYKLVWNVWSSTLQSKNDEIERLVQERDRYQQLVFDRLISSRVEPPVASEDSEEAP